MKSIDTLIPDIQALLTDMGKLSLSHVSFFSDALAKKIGSKVEEERHSGTLRLSNLGTPCRRKLWYTINRPESGEPLTSETVFKFLYGDILEETVLWLAKEAGHSVEGEQDEVNLFGVKGHIDAIVDGILVDVKSASTASFNRFAVGLTPDSDSFGYITQLQAYLACLQFDKRLRDKTVAGFIVVDKTLGKICLDRHPRSVVNYESYIDETRRLLSQRLPPPRRYEAEDFGKSGNKKLGVNCSYCPFKRECWPGLRAFAYSTGPVFLTEVRRLPDVPEIKI